MMSIGCRFRRSTSVLLACLAVMAASCTSGTQTAESECWLAGVTVTPITASSRDALQSAVLEAQITSRTGQFPESQVTFAILKNKDDRQPLLTEMVRSDGGGSARFNLAAPLRQDSSLADRLATATLLRASARARAAAGRDCAVSDIAPFSFRDA